MKGGAFTVNQLMNFFNIFTKDQHYKTMPFENIEILDKQHDLYNNQFHVYILSNPPPSEITDAFLRSKKFRKDIKSIRIVAIHRGSIGPGGFRTRKHKGVIDNVSRFMGAVKDWTNNIRNTLTYKLDKTPKTYRQERAKKGHEALTEYLTKLMKTNIQTIIESKESKSLKYMKLLLYSCLKKYGSVSAFLKNRLSTLGISQGAIYAYLYGDEGKETIVYNPAPFRGVKPKNTFILRTKNDIVSYFVNNYGLPITIKNTDYLFNFIKNHSNDILLNDFEKIGSGLFTRDTQDT